MPGTNSSQMPLGMCLHHLAAVVPMVEIADDAHRSGGSPKGEVDARYVVHRTDLSGMSLS